MTAETVYKRAIKRAGDCLAYAQAEPDHEGERVWIENAGKAAHVALTMAQILHEERLLMEGTR